MIGLAVAFWHQEDMEYSTNNEVALSRNNHIDLCGGAGWGILSAKPY